MNPNRKPLLRAIAALITAGASPSDDPIYGAIEAHQRAYRGHVEAVHIEYAYEENTVLVRDMDAEQLAEYDVLERATCKAFARMHDMSIALVTTKPTTVAGIGAVCRYMKSLLEEGTPGLPLENEFGDVETGMGVFCDTIAAAIESMA